MSIVYVPSPSDLGDNLRFVYEHINNRIERAIDTQNLDLYNDAVADMQKFYRKYLGRDYV